MPPQVHLREIARRRELNRWTFHNDDLDPCPMPSLQSNPTHHVRRVLNELDLFFVWPTWP